MSRYPSDLPSRLAQSLSWALHPILLPLYLVAALFTMTPYALFAGRMQLWMGGTLVLFGTLLPALSVGLLYRFGRLRDLRIEERADRILPLAIGALCYLICAACLARVEAAHFLRKLALAAACCEAMCGVVSLRWKISLHLTGMGAAVALLVVMNLLGLRPMFRPMLVAMVMSGLLASARLYLGRHNPWQLSAGFGGGLLLTLLVMLFL